MALQLLFALKKKLPHSLLRPIINLWPPLLAAGIQIKTLGADYRSVEVTLKLHWYNKNIVGTHFGGSIFAMTDPFYMLMLIENLGPDYTVWDKAASIDFKKPGLGTLTAHFAITEILLEKVKAETASGQKIIFDLPVDILNETNEVVASVIRTLYVRRKDAFKTPLPPAS
jgi:acyl-coenzyme A thioesterase PaaI-like protein